MSIINNFCFNRLCDFQIKITAVGYRDQKGSNFFKSLKIESSLNIFKIIIKVFFFAFRYSVLIIYFNLIKFSFLIQNQQPYYDLPPFY